MARPSDYTPELAAEISLSKGGRLYLSDALVASMSEAELRYQLRRYFRGMYDKLGRSSDV